MKKIISILLSLMMLFVFSSCEKTPEGTDPLTRKEIETIVGRFKELDNSANFSFETEWGYYTWDYPVSFVNFGSVVSYSMETKTFIKETENGVEMFSSSESERLYQDDNGESVADEYKAEYYFKDNRYYIIETVEDERKGSYQEITFAEAMGSGTSDEAFSYLPLDYDRLENASVLRRKNGRTELSYESNDLSFVKEICDVIGEESVLTEPFDSATAKFFVIFKKDGSIEKLEYDVTYLIPYELDGEASVAEIGFSYDVKVKAYGENAEINVPVPEDLDSFSKYVEEE